jgi:dolichol-phosphate mannosyltransferase
LDKSISVIIPTYNEKDNVLPLIETLHSVLSGYNYEVVFVDDNSRDGTIALVESLSKKYPVKIIVRKDVKGLATAVVEGFKHAGGQLFIVMDADLQHPPELIPNLLQALNNGADIAIASRYVTGGGMQNWSTTRKIISKGAIILSHILLPASRAVKDITSGFFAVKREVVEGAQLKPTGWKILLEILYMGKYQKVVEVPFVFALRTKGTSKLNSRQQIEYLKHIWSLMRRKGEQWRFAKFIAVGLSGVVVNLGIYWLLTRFGGLSSGYLDILSSAIAVELSIISNFTLNDFFTFHDRRNRGGNFLSRLLKFNIVSLVAVGIQLGSLWLFHHVIGINDIIAQGIGIIIGFIWNYIANSLWTWK